MAPPNRVLLCAGWACCVEPKREGVVVVWFCCVLVFPNKDGVAEGCCVAPPLEGNVSSVVAKHTTVHTTVRAWPAVHFQTVLQTALRLGPKPVCWLPGRLRTAHHLGLGLGPPTTVRWMHQRDLQRRVQVQAQVQAWQACSCCRRERQLLAEMARAVSMRRTGLLAGRAVLLSSRRDRRCLQAETSPWQRHCYH